MESSQAVADPAAPLLSKQPIKRTVCVTIGGAPVFAFGSARNTVKSMSIFRLGSNYRQFDLDEWNFMLDLTGYESRFLPQLNPAKYTQHERLTEVDAQIVHNCFLKCCRNIIKRNWDSQATLPSAEILRKEQDVLDIIMWVMEWVQHATRHCYRPMMTLQYN